VLLVQRAERWVDGGSGHLVPQWSRASLDAESTTRLFREETRGQRPRRTGGIRRQTTRF
jgi:hypothetical protein